MFYIFRLDPMDFELIEIPAGIVLLSGRASLHVDVEATDADYDKGSRDEGDWAYLPYNSMTYGSQVDPGITVRIPNEDETPLTLDAIDKLVVEEPHELDVDKYVGEQGAPALVRRRRARQQGAGRRRRRRTA